MRSGAAGSPVNTWYSICSMSFCRPSMTGLVWSTTPSRTVYSTDSDPLESMWAFEGMRGLHDRVASSSGMRWVMMSTKLFCLTTSASTKATSSLESM